MTWNYRVIRYEDGSSGLHEVYYDDNDKITFWTSEPCNFMAWPEEPYAIETQLVSALNNVRTLPVLILKELEEKFRK